MFRTLTITAVVFTLIIGLYMTQAQSANEALMQETRLKTLIENDRTGRFKRIDLKTISCQKVTSDGVVHQNDCHATDLDGHAMGFDFETQFFVYKTTVPTSPLLPPHQPRTLTQNIDTLIVLKERLHHECEQKQPKACDEMTALVDTIDGLINQKETLPSSAKTIYQQWVDSHRATVHAP